MKLLIGALAQLGERLHGMQEARDSGRVGFLLFEVGSES